MSELLLNEPTDSIASVNAYYDGARGAIRLYAWWKDGEQYVGSCGRKLADALADLEENRKCALVRLAARLSPEGEA